MTKYTPPYEITNNILDLIASIMKKIGKLDNYKDLNKMPILRRNNRIHSIHSSLAIEENSLSFKEVNPYSLKDLKKIHGIITFLTVEDSGNFRTHNEGVFDGDKCIHVCPKPEMVNNLMEQLFSWMKENKDTIHPLVLSSVFHYEFVFIHPFSDGNGRTVRLWQNILLANWEDIFEYVPIESQIKEYQEEYYSVINECNIKVNATSFIEFMLKMIDRVLDTLIESTSILTNHISTYVKKLLDVMEEGTNMSAKELMAKLGLKSRKSFRDNYLNPALENGLIKLSIPDKPTSKNQTYYKN